MSSDLARGAGSPPFDPKDPRHGSRPAIRRTALVTSGLVHFDLHTDNVLALDDGTLTGIIDWEGACAGDHRYDLVAYAFDLDGHGQQIWDRVEPLVEPHMLRAYVAHMALRRTDWAIRHHPEDVPRQLDRAERLLDRYGA